MAVLHARGLYFFLLSLFSFLLIRQVHLACTSNSTDTNCTVHSSLVVIILTQNYEQHFTSITSLRYKWENELRNLSYSSVIMSHDHYSDVDVKFIVPLLAKVFKQYDSDWYLIVKPQTALYNINNLLSLFSQYQEPRSRPYYLGRGLIDEGVKIIHHFLQPGFLMYPLDCAGFMLSHQLMKRISENKKLFTPSFTIDPLFEFSLFLKYMRYPSLAELHPSPPPTHSNGIVMTHVNAFCGGTSYHGDHCATICNEKSEFCTPPVEVSNVFFAIKTCQKYHKQRIPIQFKTWTTPTSNIRLQYYSDVTDKEFQTTSVGVANTERGHCTKLLEIFKLVLQEGGAFEWVVIADDDTLLSVDRLLSYLSCFKSEHPLVIGEVYGYNLMYVGGGYLYPTAGSGVLLTRSAVQKIVASKITCPSHDYPDDMFLGTLIKSLEISLLDTPLLHQNQPDSYHSELLSLHKSLSFHRFTPQDPLYIYRHYLTDTKIKEDTSFLDKNKNEL